MPLVAVSIRLDKIDEGLLYKAQDGSYWLSCVCVFDTDAKGRTLVVQSIPKERYAAGEKGRQIGYLARAWRQCQSRQCGRAKASPCRNTRLRLPLSTSHSSRAHTRRARIHSPPAPREPQQEPQAGELPGELGF